MTIEEKLWSLQDESYGQFQRRLLPNLPGERIIGVRTPALRALAKELAPCPAFLQDLPHRYFEENQLHAFLLERCNDFAQTVANVDAFLPYVDNWATCDQLSPKVFKKHRAELLPYIRRWLMSEHPYTVRFAIGMLMQHFLEEDFSEEYPRMVASVEMDVYYVRMEQAWYFATALAKQYDAVIPYIEQNRLERWTHNKTIQKCLESYRISLEQKEYLKQFRKK